jgi:hypothetical protein
MPEGYLLATAAGASHGEAMAISKAGWKLTDYASALEAGATNDDVRRVIAAGARLQDYAKALGLGATHTQVLEVLEARGSGDLYWYTICREYGVTHEEIMGFARSGGQIREYAYGLIVGTASSTLARSPAQLSAGGDMFAMLTTILGGALVPVLLLPIWSGISRRSLRAIGPWRLIECLLLLRQALCFGRFQC